MIIGLQLSFYYVTHRVHFRVLFLSDVFIAVIKNAQNQLELASFVLDSRPIMQVYGRHTFRAS